MSADKLSSRAIPCVFLGFPSDAPGWQFYHPTSRHVLLSQDVTFDEAVPFYCLFPYRTAPLPHPALFTASGGPKPASAEPGSAELEGAEPRGAESEGEASGGAKPGGAEPGGTEPEGAEPWGAESEGAESGGAEPRGTASARGPAGASPRVSPRREPLSPQQLCEWFAQCTRLMSGGTGAGGYAAGGTGARGAGATSLGGVGVTTRAGGIVCVEAAGPGGARTRGTGAAGAGGVGGAGAGGTGAGGTGGGGAGARGAGAGDPGGGDARAGGTSTRGAGVVCAVAGDPRAEVLALKPDSQLPAPSPYAEQTDSLTERREPESRSASPARAVRTGRHVPRPRPPLVPNTHIMALHPSSVPLRDPLLPPSASSLPVVPGPESDLARVASPAVPRLLATVV
ncbi:unnamed protein product [Closterium sp. NIES-54]